MCEEKKLNMYDNDVIFWRDGDMSHALHVQTDDDARDPLEEDPECPVKLACWHPRHTLGTPGLTKNCAQDEFWITLLNEELTDSEILEKLAKGALNRFDVKIDGNTATVVITNNANDGHSYHCNETYTYQDDVTRIMDNIEEHLTVMECQTLLYDHIASLPLWLYEHSDMTISCGDRVYPYNDQFDSSYLGWAYCKKSDLKATGIEMDDETWREIALRQIHAVVENYDQYLTGDVYWFETFKTTVPLEFATSSDWEEDDSCGGFYGSDIMQSGMIDHVGDNLKAAIETGTYRTGKAVIRTVPVTELKMD